MPETPEAQTISMHAAQEWAVVDITPLQYIGKVLFTKLQIRFYADPVDAVLRAPTVR